MDERYSRQIIMQQIGQEGQEKINKASILVIGAGGLGSPALTYLTAAGIGRLGIIDNDTAAPSNLNRQFLHNYNDIGRAKTESAKEKLSKLNNKTEFNLYNELLTKKNADALLSVYDLIIGAVDSFETRMIINRVCVSLGIPYIDGGINGFSGCVFFSHPPDTPCLNCIFPEKTIKKEPVGVLGTTAGVVGTILANTALLHLLGLQNPIKNKLFLYDGLRMNIDHVDIKKNFNCPICSKKL